MTTFIVNGQEKELQYNVNGIDISGDFIGNTTHGMEQDEEGRYIASQEDFKWWQETVNAYEAISTIITAYKEQFNSDEVDQVVEDWSGDDIETTPTQILMGLQRNFGKLL